MPNSKSKIFELIESKLDSLIKNVYVTVKRYKFTITISVLLLIIGLFIWIKFSNSQANQYPFIAEVWGTVSDWLMVVVAGVTAVFLLATFYEQRQSNMIQNEANRIAVLPEFQIANVPSVSQESDTLQIQLTRNSAYNLASSRYHQSFFTKQHNGLVRFHVQVGQTIQLADVRVGPQEPARYIFTYRDISGRLYVQSICSEPNGNFWITNPQEKTPEQLTKIK